MTWLLAMSGSWPVRPERVMSTADSTTRIIIAKGRTAPRWSRISPGSDVRAHGDRAPMGRGRALSRRGRVGDRDGDLSHARGRDARASGRQPAVPDADRSAECPMRRSQRRFVADRDEIGPGADPETDLLEPLGREKGGDGSVGAFVYAEASERTE